MIIYPSGRFRHYLEPHNQGELDLPRMEREKQDELWWETRLWQAGHMVIAPLRMTTGIEQFVDLPQHTWIERDCELLGCIERGKACILMRPGWDTALINQDRPEWYRPEWAYDPSVGAAAELEVACARDFGVLEGMHGWDAVIEEIARREAV